MYVYYACMLYVCMYCCLRFKWPLVNLGFFKPGVCMQLFSWNCFCLWCEYVYMCLPPRAFTWMDPVWLVGQVVILFLMVSVSLHNSSTLTKLIIMIGVALVLVTSTSFKTCLIELKQGCISHSFHCRRHFVGVTLVYQAFKIRVGCGYRGIISARKKALKEPYHYNTRVHVYIRWV